MTTDRLPPQDVETETACIASALLNREALLRVTEILQPEDFYLEKHRIIFEAISELEKKSLPIDLTTLRQILIDKSCLERIGGEFRTCRNISVFINIRKCRNICKKNKRDESSKKAH